MNTPLKTTLEIARLQHSERILSKTQQDAMLLAAPGLSECWQAHAKRQTVLIPAAGVLAAVADGVSLSPQAAFASRSFLQQLNTQFDSGSGAPSSAIPSALPQLVRHSHRLWQKQCLRPDTRGASSTLAALLIRGQQVSVVNVGDSRVWRLRHVDGALQCQQLSHDHTLWQQMLDAGEVAHTGEQPASFYQDLTQCLTLGDAHDDVCADDALDSSEDFVNSDEDTDSPVVPEQDWLHSWQGAALPGDIWLLATDGLHGCITGFELQNYWQAEKTITENLNHLYAAWSASGGGDDISLMAMRFICPVMKNL